MGDIVVSLATARALRELWPKARHEMVVDRMAADLVEASSVVDEVLSYAPPRNTATRAFYDLRWWRDLRARRYDVVFDLMGTPQTAQWTWLSGARLRVGRRRRGRTWAYNHVLSPYGRAVRFAGDEVLDFARSVGARCEAWKPSPMLPQDDPKLQDAWPPGKAPWIILHPAANWSAKAWPRLHWISLIRELAAAGLDRLEISWGPGEEAWRDGILRETAGLASAIPPTSLIELTRRLSRCDLLIAVDSGVVHLAVAQGTPTLSLFGSTNEKGWHHSSSLHRALIHEVSCRPCNLTVCPVEGHPCLELLTPERVKDEALALLQAGTEVAK